MSLDDITLAVDYFDLKKIAESGQCFRWKELGPGKYLIPSGQTCAIMEQKEPDDDLHLLIEEGTLPLWQDYLNYGERYGSIVREAREATLADGSPDLFLREAVLEAAGVQILTQDLWETLVSFVISQNNNIPRIKKLVAALCKQFGDRRPDLRRRTPHPDPAPRRPARLHQRQRPRWHLQADPHRARQDQHRHHGAGQELQERRGHDHLPAGLLPQYPIPRRG